MFGTSSNRGKKVDDKLHLQELSETGPAQWDCCRTSSTQLKGLWQVPPIIGCSCKAAPTETAHDKCHAIHWTCLWQTPPMIAVCVKLHPLCNKPHTWRLFRTSATFCGSWWNAPRNGSFVWQNSPSGAIHGMFLWWNYVCQVLPNGSFVWQVPPNGSFVW